MQSYKYCDMIVFGEVLGHEKTFDCKKEHMNLRDSINMVLSFFFLHFVQLIIISLAIPTTDTRISGR